MTTHVLPLVLAVLGRLHYPATTVDRLGFGYSRDLDAAVGSIPVPDGVELIALTGRTPRLSGDIR
jgi:hypothetical protein